MRLTVFCIIIVMLLPSLGGKAQERSVATQVGIGAANTLDTYLSPEKYRGTEWRMQSEVRRDGTSHPSLSFALTHEAAFAYTHNRALSGHQYAGHYDFSYAAMRRWDLLDNALHLYAGAMTDAMIGFAYNTHNGNNNPAQGYGSLTVGAHLAAKYSFTLFNKSITVGYEARYPMFGLMFSPNYGQSYYEIFSRGNYDRNITAIMPDVFQLRQQLTVDVPVGKSTSVRLGYLNDIRQAKPNNLKQHHYYNGLIMGMVISK